MYLYDFFQVVLPGSTGADIYSPQISSGIFFGRQGADEFRPAREDTFHWFVGGSGGDYYLPPSYGGNLTIVQDAVASSGDVYIDQAIGSDYLNGQIFLVDGRHLGEYNSWHNRAVLIPDWLDERNRFEKIVHYGQEMTFDQFINWKLTHANFAGAISMEEFLGVDTATANVIRQGIDEVYDVAAYLERGAPPPVAYLGPSDIQSAADGASMFAEVASDDTLAVPIWYADSQLAWTEWDGDSARVLGSSGRDFVYFEEGDLLARAEGGEGDDVYVVRYVPGALTGGDPRIIERDGEGNDTVWVSVSDYILPNGVENLVSMTENGVRMLANDGNNKFIGGPGDDQLFSGFGEDIVYGREGNDLIVGGDETDALFGAAGDDTFAWELGHVGDDDRIWDWDAGDRLDLRGLGGVVVTRNGADTQVWHDPNRDGVADAHIVTVIGVDRDLIEAAITL
jgi:Ca2+-binding RTX toxin-like protein